MTLLDFIVWEWAGLAEGMSGSEQESKSDGKLVSIPLSSDDETPGGEEFKLKVWHPWFAN